MIGNNMRTYGSECMINRSSIIDNASLDELQDYINRCDERNRDFDQLSTGRKIFSYLFGNPFWNPVHYAIAKKKLEAQVNSN